MYNVLCFVLIQVTNIKNTPPLPAHLLLAARSPCWGCNEGVGHGYRHGIEQTTSCWQWWWRFPCLGIWQVRRCHWMATIIYLHGSSSSTTTTTVFRYLPNIIIHSRFRTIHCGLLRYPLLLSFLGYALSIAPTTPVLAHSAFVMWKLRADDQSFLPANGLRPLAGRSANGLRPRFSKTLWIVSFRVKLFW